MLLLLLSAWTACAQEKASHESQREQKPWWDKLVSAQDIEKQASQQYAQLVEQAYQSHALLGPLSPRVTQVRGVANALILNASSYNPRASQWAWEVNVIDAQVVNAFCMPAGKIVVYAGLMVQLGLSDEELAVVLGHEMAHALLEHSRARLAKEMATQGVARLGGVLAAGVLGVDPRLGEYVASEGAGLLSLKFSREDEQAADALGLELAARSGFDPRASVTLWKKMQGLNKTQAPVWLSTHPSDAARVQSMQALWPKVMPLFEKAQHDARVKAYHLQE
jgi:predicted Zn-dependent protease